MYCLYRELLCEGNISYQCQHTVKSEGWLCGDSFYCADGKCAAMQENQNGDFSQAVSALAAIAAAGKDVAEMDPSKVSAFYRERYVLPKSCSWIQQLL
ncbi:type-F conjugative transfer system mating-pair stabilization protein TraN [Klebsiella pneumoniae]|nr:type-F conjugative transfer system mating-pair stabilization protein TraN [Klebsiella pneumoniae]